MKDEEYSFVSDVIDKKITARSARNRRTHNGKGGAVKLPHEYLSKKELQAMNGECKTYRLNEPMKWDEFKAMPDDIKVTYIKLLRKRYDVPDSKIGEMMGASKDQISRFFRVLGLRETVKRNPQRKWDSEGWFAFVNGVSNGTKDNNVVQNEDEPYIPISEDEYPFEEYPVEKTPELHIDSEEKNNEEQKCYGHVSNPVPVPASVHVAATPESGNLVFQCNANLALNMLAQILGESKARITIKWDLIHEGDEPIYG